MSDITKHFVFNQNIPDFIKSDHDVYATFVKAYYEWLELRNDSESSSYSDVYKAVGNPAYIVNNQEILVDVDATIDEFIDFFANEVVPISLEGIQTNPRFFLKHIRDLYLAKGTIQSFKLFFKLYYNDEIEVFETRDNVLRASDGKYFAFPNAHFYVTDFEEQVKFVDFTLATITDDSNNLIGTILDGAIVGNTPEKETIVKIQFSNDLDLKEKTPYYIKSSDGSYKIKVEALVTLSEINLSKTAPLYNENDPIFIESKSLNKTFLGSITSVSKGSVNGIKVRDKGILYNTNDYFQFENENNVRGRFNVTKVSGSGEVLEIDNIPLRTGSTNNGFLANTLEDVYVTISNGGTNWKQLPKIKYNPDGSSTTVSQPYPEVLSSSGIGLQTIALSSTIGKANGISVNQETFFKDSEDVVINPPANVIVENNTLKVGDKVSFQVFGNTANFGPLIDDSETLTLRYRVFRLFGDAHTPSYVYKDSEINRKDNVTIIYGFDSDTFEWKTKNVEIDLSRPDITIFNPITELLDLEGNVSYKTRFVSGEVEVIDGGFVSPEIKIDIFHYYTLSELDGGGGFPFLGTNTKLDGGAFDDITTSTIEGGVSFDFDDYDVEEQDRIEYHLINYKYENDLNKLQYSEFPIDTNLDSEMFNSITDFLTTYHVGPISIETSLYNNIIMEGGDSFEYKNDSEIAGNNGFNNSDSDIVIDGGDSFKYLTVTMSRLHIKYLDMYSDSEIDAGNVDFSLYVKSDSEIEYIEGSKTFKFVGANFADLEVEFSGSYLEKLSTYHFKQIDELVGMDSDKNDFSWWTTKGEPRLPISDSDMGEWVDTGYFGKVIDVSHNNQVAKIITYDNHQLPTQEQIDSWSVEKYNIVKISPLNHAGVSNKDYSLPLTNVVHQIDRMDVSYKTSVISDLYKKFYNEDGFLSSDVMNLRDNYYFSDWSYRIKSKLPYEDWKQKFKTLLHPAGMVLTATYVQNLEVTNALSPSTYTKWSNDFLPNLTFDQNQEYVDTKSAYSINADNIYYKSNGFEAKNILTGLTKQLDGSSQTSLSDISNKQQSGNAFWDYEPIGWVRKSTVRVSAADTVNMDSESYYTNRFSTQDSDGNGFVKNSYTYYKTYNESKQDFYKNDSRLSKYLRANYLISKVQIEDAEFTKYSAYDSELPEDFMVTFVDSDNNFNAINYDRLKSENDSRHFSVYTIPRVAEITARKEKDLRLAMKENGSLVWDDSDKVYYDYEAYEKKWNEINNRRTKYIDGYSIKGYIQYTGYEHIEQRSNKRSKEFVVIDHKEYSTKNAPLSSTVWNADTLIWKNTYYDQINTTYIEHKYEKETYKDPQVSMRSRRGR